MSISNEGEKNRLEIKPSEVMLDSNPDLNRFY